MARGSDQAKTAATSGQNLSNQAASNANALYGSLAPELQSQAANPQGYAPSDLAAMNTSAMQSAGGSQAGAVGQGSLLASRTRNSGTADAAIGDSARSAGQNLGTAALKTQTANAALKQNQRQSALGGLEGLYGVNTGQSTAALGQVAQNVNANTQAANASYDWSKYLLSPIMGAASSVGSAAI